MSTNFSVQVPTSSQVCECIINGWGGASLNCTSGDRLGAQNPTPATFIITSEISTVSLFTPAGAGLGRVHNLENGTALCSAHARKVAESLSGTKVTVKDLKALAS